MDISQNKQRNWTYASSEPWMTTSFPEHKDTAPSAREDHVASQSHDF